MSFEYSCFVSYRHCQSQLGKRIINDLYNAICGELELMTDKEVYLDRERLEGGYFYNEALARALCRSVCMIVVFTPTYFNMHHTYCAREYKAMEALEKKRLRLLEDPDDRTHGLIIPVVFRGWDYLPLEIKERRQCHDFSDFLLCDTEICSHPGYAPKVRQIAEYIASRCNTFDALGIDAYGGCEDFTLPTERKIRPWLEEVTNHRIPFPGREEGK